MLGRHVGWAMSAYVRAGADAADHDKRRSYHAERTARLIEQHDDFPLGGSDATISAIAERCSIKTILTTDLRHFAAGPTGTRRGLHAS